jgi:hypothetical protein
VLAVSPHIHYEWWMLQETARALSAGLQPVWQRNAVLEAFVMHGRALVEFLWTPPAGRHFRTDVLAADYFDPSSDWTLPDEPVPPLLRPLTKRANVQIAHLSYERLVERPSGWLQSDMADALSAHMVRFVAQALPHGRLDPQLDWASLGGSVQVASV